MIKKTSNLIVGTLLVLTVATLILVITVLPVEVVEHLPVYSQTTGMRLARDGESVGDSLNFTLSTLTITLPTGFTFMYIIPAEEAQKINPFWKLQNVYVVRLTNGHGRRIEFLQAGNSPGSWNVVLTIEER